MKVSPEGTYGAFRGLFGPGARAVQHQAGVHKVVGRSASHKWRQSVQRRKNDVLYHRSYLPEFGPPSAECHREETPAAYATKTPQPSDTPTPTSTVNHNARAKNPSILHELAIEDADEATSAPN